jgi:hypothetical protein
VLCVLSLAQQRAAQGLPLEQHLTFITGAAPGSSPLLQNPVERSLLLKSVAPQAFH